MLQTDCPNVNNRYSLFEDQMPLFDTLHKKPYLINNTFFLSVYTVHFNKRLTKIFILI